MRHRSTMVAWVFLLLLLVAQGCSRPDKAKPTVAPDPSGPGGARGKGEPAGVNRAGNNPGPKPSEGTGNRGRSAFTLANGLRVRLVPSQDEKKVVVLLGVRAGFLDEPGGVPHVAHVTEHLTVFGAPAGSEEAVAVARWYQAGQANAETLADLTYFDLQVVREELPLALRVQAARLGGAVFSPQILAREIPRTLAEIESMERSVPGGTGKFALCAFVQAAFHGRKEALLKAKTRGMTLDNVRNFYKHTFRPDRAILSVVGDFDPAAARKTIEATLAALPEHRTPAPGPRPRPKSGARTVHWDVGTRHLIVAWPAPPAAELDHAALTLASFLLMQRLFMDPEVSAAAKQLLVSNDAEGLFLVNLQARAGENLDALQDKLLAQVTRLSKPAGLTDIEVTRTRSGFAQVLGPVGLDAVPAPPNVSRTMMRANLELQKMMMEIVRGDLAAYARRVEAVDAAAIRRAVARHLDPKAAVAVRVEPMK